LYCNEPNCACRRALVQVYWAEGNRVAATVNYAFEPPKAPFRRRAAGLPRSHDPQSDSSSVLFDMFKEMIAADRAYHDRLVRHYEMRKRVVDDPTHPKHARARSTEHDDPSFARHLRGRSQSSEKDRRSDRMSQRVGGSALVEIRGMGDT